jgi:predicted Zn-dependent protease
LFAYVPQTRAEYSVTVRNSKGTGAGWAGQEHLDWRKLDPDKLSATALEKCVRSADPVAVEPGRYTVILEPQAVAGLMYHLVESLERIPPERGIGPWADRVTPPDPIVGGRARFGERVLDSRITIQTDPLDPDAPFLPFGDREEPTRAVTWVKDGILTNLSYPRVYALTRLNKEDPMLNTFAFRMSGGDTSVEEMIASTARGLLITRFVDVRQVRSLTFRDIVFCTGRTSDGLWLIERGKITKSVKNFRFREEVVSVFNNVIAMGPPTRVLMNNPTIVPPVMVRDFSLTSLSDGV